MKTVLIFGALLVLSVSANAFPSIMGSTKKEAEVGMTERQDDVSTGQLSELQVDDTFIFSKGFTFNKKDVNGTVSYEAEEAGACKLSILGQPNNEAHEVQLTRALNWKVRSVRTLENGDKQVSLKSAEAASREIVINCTPSEEHTDALSDLQSAGIQIQRKRLVEQISYDGADASRHVRIRLDGEMPIDSYDRRGTIYDGQTGDRTPRPRPGQR